MWGRMLFGEDFQLGLDDLGDDEANLVRAARTSKHDLRREDLLQRSKQVTCDSNWI